MRDEIRLAYKRNGEPLSHDHGAPVRLIVPGWFGIAWVKWLTRTEVLDRRYMSKFMAREYVTIRGEEREGETIWRETSVGPMDVKSVVARAVRGKDGSGRLTGAAWTDGTRLSRVEVRIEDGRWQTAELGRPFEDVTFAAKDGTKLNGWFFPSNTNSSRSHLAVLLCHGNAGNISGRLDMCAALLATGVNVFAFDYRGYGRSEGRPGEEGTYLDAQAAYHWLQQKGFRGEPIIAFGESM